jgi:small multidrug resistance pump
MAYLCLAFPVIVQAIATSVPKALAESTKLVHSSVAITGYCIAFYLLTLILRSTPTHTFPLIGMTLFIAGAVIINRFSKIMAD